ncbi:MAG: hypothetical protein DLM70_00860, partial [Chloroflexi bacterium]
RGGGGAGVVCLPADGRWTVVAQPLPADLQRLVAVLVELRREMRLATYRRDSLVLQVGKEIATERMAAFAGHERFEPDTPMEVD